MALVVEVEDPTIERLTLTRALDTASWQVTYHNGEKRSWTSCRDDIVKFVGGRDVYLSVDQERDGQHLFVRLKDALDALPTLIGEAEVKAIGPEAQLLYARRPVEAPKVFASWRFPDLAPHGAFTNYSIVPWLCLGRTQALILSDEATLRRDLPNERIFEHLTLIVNCHEDRVDLAKYRAGAKPGAPRPTVVAHAIHRWFSNMSASIEKNDAIQRAIWHHLQHGSVAIHCLAGIHRAAVVTACHFLFRHYSLGHKDIPADFGDIYRKLRSVRPAVSPAYLDILRRYEAHVKANAA
ncbi:hypothetical protein CTAYLR_006020 [Chrysophaeum taylorii]|uniref:Tyrosine specific protein phosphatases domain-containing protein n=1 Tax=Chrysophaeum taylorii TaxID=2483200 RepID=A0AAD7UJR3_9STRA|nr:hypothetical protein CTAYLR_006020 [Chrysophaeum taylorii]